MSPRVPTINPRDLDAIAREYRDPRNKIKERGRCFTYPHSCGSIGEGEGHETTSSKELISERMGILVREIKEHPSGMFVGIPAAGADMLLESARDFYEAAAKAVPRSRYDTSDKEDFEEIDGNVKKFAECSSGDFRDPVNEIARAVEWYSHGHRGAACRSDIAKPGYRFKYRFACQLVLQLEAMHPGLLEHFDLDTDEAKEEREADPSWRKPKPKAEPEPEKPPVPYVVTSDWERPNPLVKALFGESISRRDNDRRKTRR